MPILEKAAWTLFALGLARVLIFLKVPGTGIVAR